jgi:peptidyl-prolyl cis-trans isomerase C
MTPTDKTNEPADRNLVLVEVNGQTLSESDLSERVESMIAQQQGQIPPEQMPAVVAHLRVSAVRDFITQVLLEGEAIARDIKPTDEEMQKALAEVAGRLPPGQTLEKALAMGGMSLDDFKVRIGTELRIRRLLDAEMQKAPPATEDEAKSFYEEQKGSMSSPDTVTARHILVMSKPNEDLKTRETKRAKIEDIRTQLELGADFARLAEEHSECPSGKEGGSLGSFGRGQMVKPFEDAAFTQAVNAIGPVVETSFGYHLIQVTDKKGGALRSFEEVKGQILEHLNRLHRQQIFQAIVDALQAKATIMMDPSIQQEMESGAGEGA